MAIGFETFNFQVLEAFKGPDLESLKKCCRGGHQLIFLENRDKLNEVPIKYLIGIYKFFTGNIARHPEPGVEAEWLKDMVPVIRMSFDDKKIKDSKSYVKPESASKKEASKEAQKKAPKAPRETEPEEETITPKQTQKETEMATKKAAKKATKKTASKKAPKKAADGEGKRGRKARYEDGDKIKLTVKDNPCNPTFAGKPSRRHGMFNLIAKNNGCTFADYMKKGGNATDLFDLQKKKYVTVGGK